MDNPLLAYSIWLGYTAEQKQKLQKLFSIPRTGESVVHVGAMIDGNIAGERKQDGHRPEDLYAVSISRMTELLNLTPKEVGAEANFYQLFQEVVDNLDAIYYEQYPDEVPVVPASAPVPEAPAPIAETVPEFVPRNPEELLKKSDVAPENPVEEIPSAELTLEDGVLLADGEPVEEITKTKMGTNAKTTKAKGSKTK